MLPIKHMPTKDTLSEDTSQKKLLASESLSVLREKWINSYEFATSISISDEKYMYLRLNTRV